MGRYAETHKIVKQLTRVCVLRHALSSFPKRKMRFSKHDVYMCHARHKVPLASNYGP